MTVFEAARQADCVRAAEHLGLRIRRSGGRAYTCCLFHAERTPSMCLYPGDGGFYCFGCHAHGDAVDLYGRALNLAPLEAARQVCRDFGFQYEAGKRPGRPPMPPQPKGADARALARRLDALREKRADGLLAMLRSAQALMERAEAAHRDPEAILEDPDWRRAMAIRATAQEQLAMLDSMTLAQFLDHIKAESGAKPATTGDAQTTDMRPGCRDACARGGAAEGEADEEADEDAGRRDT